VGYHRLFLSAVLVRSLCHLLIRPVLIGNVCIQQVNRYKPASATKHAGAVSVNCDVVAAFHALASFRRRRFHSAGVNFDLGGSQVGLC